MSAAPSPPPSPRDVRMCGFAARATVEQALTWIDERLAEVGAGSPGFGATRRETIPLAEAAGRVLATDIVSPIDVPGFARSMMDGFAVQAADTYGASAYNRLPLSIIGRTLAGERFSGRLSRGEAVRIMTGAALL